MNPIANLKEALHLRMYGYPDDYYEESVWKTEVEAACTDLQATIAFILSECTDEELYWLREVFEDIVDRTRSVEFIKCLQKRVQSVDNPEWKQSILEDIRTAAEYIDR